MVGIITLFVSAAVFYIVLFSFIFYWHLKRVTFMVVPMVFGFEFFVMCFLVVCIISIIIQYVPEIVRVVGL